MNRYAIVDGDGNIVNVAVWDGEAVWEPSADAVEVPAGAAAEPGGRRVPGGKPEWVPAPKGSDN